MTRLGSPIVVASVVCLHAGWANAQIGPGTSGNPGSPGAALLTDAPSAPVLPETVHRDEHGRATVRAVRLTEPIRLDGRLDEAVYQSVNPIGDFIQT